MGEKNGSKGMGAVFERLVLCGEQTGVEQMER